MEESHFLCVQALLWASAWLSKERGQLGRGCGRLAGLLGAAGVDRDHGKPVSLAGAKASKLRMAGAGLSEGQDQEAGRKNIGEGLQLAAQGRARIPLGTKVKFAFPLSQGSWSSGHTDHKQGFPQGTWGAYTWAIRESKGNSTFAKKTVSSKDFRKSSKDSFHSFPLLLILVYHPSSEPLLH